MQKITPHLWFDTQAKEAAQLYTSLFKDSKILHTTTLHNTPSGSVDMLTIELWGKEFMLISAGPFFTFTPAISFVVVCDTADEVDVLWKGLSEGGKPLMELGTYPFSQKYGWIQDRYGLSWQIMIKGEGEVRERITPSVLFVGSVCGKAEEAIRLYTSVFRNAGIGDMMRYKEGQEPEVSGTITYASFTLEGQQFSAMDSAREHNFSFSEAISFIIHCDTQEEIDYYFEKLSADPTAEQCGWVKDRYGVSWQIVPTIMEELLASGDQKKVDRVTEVFLKMKKFDIKTLQEAAKEKI